MTVYWEMEQQSVRTCSYVTGRRRNLSAPDAGRQADLRRKELSAQIGSSRLSFAKSEYMEKYLDITPGSVSVLGLMNDIEGKVRLLIDEDVLTERYFGCHPCINTSSLKFTTEDLIGKVIPALKHAPKMVKLGMTES